MELTQSSCVYLTLKHLDPDFVRKRFPGIDVVCKGFGLDITKDSIPVRPGAHYMIGGATIDMEGRTSLPGLWAAGEVTSSGLHGANRLASNSLLEGLVYGAAAGKAASASALARQDQPQVLPIQSGITPHTSQSIDIADIRNAVRSAMWRHVGVQRTANRLNEVLQSTKHLSSYVLAQAFDSIDGWELQNLLTVALLMSTFAHRRTSLAESIFVSTTLKSTNETGENTKSSKDNPHNSHNSITSHTSHHQHRRLSPHRHHHRPPFSKLTPPQNDTTVGLFETRTIPTEKYREQFRATSSGPRPCHPGHPEAIPVFA